MAQNSSNCRGYTIPPGTLSYFENGALQVLTVTNAGVFAIDCLDPSDFSALPVNKLLKSGWETFHESVVPILYTLPGTTALAWLILILLLISQTRRPWLQMVAVLYLAITLSITLDRTSNLLQHQYDRGYQDADELKQQVLTGSLSQGMAAVAMGLLWLAHTQIAERLFPKRREKLMTRIVGTSLAVLDTIMRLLCYLGIYRHVKDSYGNPFYILAYIVDIFLAVSYVVIVLLYSLRKRQYAYQGKAALTGTISFIGIILPIVFLTLSMISPWINGWAAFVSLAFNASALVVVWGWIDIIELREKQEQSFGVMGRVIYEPKLAEDFEKMSGHGKASGTHMGKIFRHDGGGTAEVLPKLKRALIVPFRRGTSAESAVTCYGSSQESSGVPMTDIAPVDPSDTPSEPALERISYPVRRSIRVSGPTSTTPNIIENEERDEQNTSINHRGSNEDGDIYDNGMALQLNEVDSAVDSVHDMEEGEPPNVFNRIPGFDPRDYWDDKGHETHQDQGSGGSSSHH